MARKITILGMGDSARSRRYDIERYTAGTEVWGLNNGYNTFPTLTGGKKFDRMFELHAWEYLKAWVAGTSSDGKPIDHFSTLHNLGCKVVSGQHLPVIQNQEQIDWLEVFSHFGMPVYFLGSPSVMLALALYEHDNGQTIEYIQSYGIDTKDPSHMQQRSSWAFWICRAIDRGIKIGGTALDFMQEPDNDVGLAGIKDMITAELLKRNRNKAKTGDVSKYTVATVYTDDDYYRGGMERLKAQAESFGLDFYAHLVKNKPEGVTIRRWATSQKPVAIVEAMDAFPGQGVLYLDADDELLAAPAFPVCDIGYSQNPEMGAIPTHLHYAPFGFFANSKPAREFCKQWREFCELAGDHRALQMTITMLLHQNGKNGTFSDVTDYFKNCIRYNASPLGYRPTLTT